MAGWCPAAGAVAQSDQIRWVEIIIGWNIARAPLLRNYLLYIYEVQGGGVVELRGTRGTWSELNSRGGPLMWTVEYSNY